MTGHSVLLLFCAFACAARAQEAPPTLRVQSNLVLVPTLVEAADGGVVYVLGSD